MATRRRTVVWTPSAYRGLEEASNHIALDSVQAARDIVEAALRTAESLCTLGERGRWVPEFDEPSIREILVFKYRLLYKVTEREILLLAFLHGARDFERLRRAFS